MKNAKILCIAASLALLAGCSSDDKKPTTKAKSGESEEHIHGKGPNGGLVFDLGKYHAEFTVDHGKKECAIITLGDDEKTVTAVAAKDMTVTTKPTKTKDGKEVPSMTIKLQPLGEKDGKASKFVGADPGLGNVAEFEGTVTAVIDGKPAKGTFKEEDEDEKKK